MEHKVFDFLGNWYSDNFSINFSYPENKFNLKIIENSIDLFGNFEMYSNYIILKTSEFSSITFKIITKEDDKIILENLTFNVGTQIILKKGLYELRNIKQFELGDLIDISLEEFKEMVEIENIGLNRAKDINGNPTKYYRYWNNEGRFSILMEEETLKYLKNHPLEKINVYSKIKKSEKDYYTNFFISLYKGSIEEYNYNRDMKEMYYENNLVDYENEAFNTAFEGNQEVWDNYTLR